MMMKIAIATERSDLHRLAYSAIRAANSHNVSDDDRCFDILRYMKSLNLSVKYLCHSKAILPLASLRDHENPKIRMEANVLFNSWMKTLYSSGRNSSTCNEAIPLKLKKVGVVKVCSELKREENMQVSHDIAAETKKKTEVLGMQKKEDERSRAHETGEIKQLDDCKSFAARLLQTKKQIHETAVTKQNLKKPNDCKSFAAKSIQAKKQSALPMKLSEKPRFEAHETGEIKKTLKKLGVCKSVLPTPRTLQKKKQTPLKDSQNPKYCPTLKKNSTEMLELFEIAKKSADVANAKGLLAAKAEASICVDTLSLLMDFPISSAATETRRIMVRLESLTKHKDRKICNSASALLHCWGQNIRNQRY